MKRLQLTILLVAMALSARALAADPLLLKISHLYTPLSPLQVRVFQPWCETLEKESAGRMKCQIYPSMQLGGAPSQLVDQVKNGVADVVWTVAGLTPGRFPALEALELPFVISDGLGSARGAWEYQQKFATKELDGFKLLAIHTDGGTLFHFGDKNITDLAGLKGTKIRASNRMSTKTISALGATPVALPPTQITEAVAKGVVDGVMSTWELVIPLKLDDVTKFHLEPPAGKPTFGGTVLIMLMNKQRYQNLPPDLRAIIDKNSGPALVDALGRVWDDGINDVRKKIAASSATTTVVSEREYEAMRKAASVVEKDWIQEVTAKGFNGAAMAAAAHTMAGRTAK